jgi:hypothetical protein
MEGKHELAGKTSRAALVTRYLTYSAGGFFVLGVLLTLVFTTTNVSNISAILKKELKSQEQLMNENALKKIVLEPLRKGVEPANLIKVPEPQPIVVTPDHSAPKRPQSPQETGKK